LPWSELVSVVQASLSDVNSVHDFIIDAWKEAGPTAPGWTGATEENVNGLARPDHIRRLLSSRKTRIFLAKQGKEVQGFAATREVDEHTSEIAGIIVRERYVGRGVGTALLRAALAAIWLGRCTEVIVKTERINERATRFYEKNGFAKVGEEQENVDGTKIDLVILSKPRDSAKL